MTLHTPFSPRGLDQLSSRATGLLVGLSLLLPAALLPRSAAAQATGQTTVTASKVENELPADRKGFKSVPPVTLNFPDVALPAGARVTKATFRLVCKAMSASGRKDQGADSDGKVSWGEGEKDFTQRTYKKTGPGINSPCEWPLEVTGDKWKSHKLSELKLKLESTSPEDERVWHSIAADESNQRPRLILEYTLPDKPDIVPGEGLPYTHSPQRFLAKPNFDPWAATARDVKTKGVQSYAPVFYKDLVLMIVDDSLVALSPLGDRQVWSVMLDKPGQHLVLSESGRLYIVGKEKILAYKLDPNDPSKPPMEVQGLSPQAAADLKPARAPAVGLDGSLFFVNNTAVYGLSPQLQELWKVSLTSTDVIEHPVTVGPSGKFVYLVGKKNDKMGLIAVDARTGEDETKEFSIQPTWTVLHAPVVLRHDDDGSEIIYAGANSSDDGLFACFYNRRTIEKHETDKLVRAGELRGLFSQPTAVRATNGAKGWRIYAVKVAVEEGQKKGQLISADGPGDLKETKNVDTSFSLGNGTTDEPYLLNGGNLAVDRDGNVLVWTGYKATFSAFSPTTRALSTTLESVSTRAQLLFGTDGTLYAASVGNTRELRAIVPKYTIPVGATGGVVSSPTHLIVDGTAGSDTPWTLSAPGRVQLGNGFTVTKGTSLAIKGPAH
jgi:hypothetical protein